MNEKHNYLEIEFEVNKELENNIVYIGSKETIGNINYSLSQFLNPETKEIILSARGNRIPTAVYIACALKYRYIRDLNLRTEIGSELLNNNHVPFICIHCSKFACVM